MNHPEQEIIENKMRRAAAINALRKIGKIVASENQADMGAAQAAAMVCPLWLDDIVGRGSVAGLWRRHNLEG